MEVNVQMNPGQTSYHRPIVFEVDSKSESSSTTFQPLGKTYSEGPSRTQGFLVPSRNTFSNPIHIPQSGPSASPASGMAGTTTMQYMPTHHWQGDSRQALDANTGPMPSSAASGSRFDQLLRAKLVAERSTQDRPMADMQRQQGQLDSASASSRFEQLVRTKLAAEQQTADEARAPVFAAPAGFNDALAKMQSAETVFNTGFVRQHYNNTSSPVEKKSHPPVPVSGPSSAPQSFYSYAPPSQERSSLDLDPNNSGATPHDPNCGGLGYEELTANFRSIITARINNMYATTIRAQGNNETPIPEATKLSQPYQTYQLSPVNPANNSASYHHLAQPMNMSPSPSASQVPTTPSYKYGSSWNEPQPADIKPAFEAYQNTAYPFVWNVTPPQSNQAHAPVYTGGTPSLHCASDSMDSGMSVSPMTPKLPTYSQLALQVDVKPVISPALSTVSLPQSETSSLSFARYGPALFANMNGQPQYTSASGENHTNGSNGGAMYDGSHGMNSSSIDGTNGLGDLGFPQENGNGSGDGDGNDDSQNGDDGSGNPGPSGPTPRGKKLPLACHFCRRRKLKCDGVKPTCENCRKRGQECTFDDSVRRRGPGKRTKEMRDRAARDAEAGGIMSAQALAAHQAALAQTQDIPEDLDQHDQPAEVDIGDADLILDPALAGEDGGARHSDVMEAMGALKQAGIDLGLHDDDGLGEPSTLAEIGDLDAMKEFKDFDRFDDFHKEDSEESRKRKELEGLGDFDSQGDMKRMRLSTGELNELELLQHVEHVQQQVQDGQQ